MTKYTELKNGAIFGPGIPNPFSQFFIGDTFLNTLTQSPDEKINIGTVDFAPGARNNWHIHLMSMLSFWFLLPQMMQSQYGFNALQAGLAFFPLTVIMFLISMRLPMITAKFGQTKTLLFGEIMLGLGMLLLALANFNASYWSAIALPMVFLGIGQGFILSPVTSLGIYETSNELAGIASGITNTMHQIGGPIGLSLVLMVGGNIHTNLWVMFSFIVVAIVIALFLVLQQDIEYQK
ncbi:MFS transporter [Weissella soli]|uniref:MFS transporter n=1 Tax=Weissella soli TaxID=155866 RepID=UPI001F3CD966|nr:MFS transporter [Weissella soli]GJM47922.1 hypothetical protein WSSLDB02_04790 [Weissella soli]